MTTAVTTINSTNIISESANESIAKLAKEWIDFVDVQPTTFATYNRAMKNFLRWLADNGVMEVNREVVITYRDSLLQKLQPTTCRLYVACVKLFIKFLASKGICPDFTAHLPFDAKNLINNLTQATYRRQVVGCSLLRSESR